MPYYYCDSVLPVPQSFLPLSFLLLSRRFRQLSKKESPQFAVLISDSENSEQAKVSSTKSEDFEV